MRTNVRNAATYATVFALIIWISPVSAVAGESGARLEGLVVDVDGRPAAGYTVHLIDDGGEAESAAVAGEDGIYSFKSLPAGDYTLGIETPEGVVAPVAAPPVRLAGGELARRDLKLVQADTAAIQQAATANYGFGMWWAGLSTGAKVGVVLAFIAAAYGVAEAFDDDDEGEPAASVF